MQTNLFQGKLVRLTAEEPAILASTYISWDRDSEYRRLLDDVPPRLWSKAKHEAWATKSAEKPKPGLFGFHLRTLKDDRLIGFVELWLTKNKSDAWAGIGIGDRQDWSQGYGTDALEVILHYAFMELNLFRVSLGLFEYNSRALRAYEKAGFVLEGRERGAISRDGVRSDALVMGILRDEWEQRHAALANNGSPKRESHPDRSQ